MNNEAVAAALALVDAPRNSDAEDKAMDAVRKYAKGFEFTGEAAARILAAEVRRLREESERYAGWSRWRAGLWRITHNESSHDAEWVGE